MTHSPSCLQARAMVSVRLTTCLILALLAIGRIEAFRSQQSDSVLLTSVQTLVLQSGAYTTGRRSSPVAQLTCTGGSAGCSEAPHSVMCRNMGSDGQDVTWKCEADLPDSIKLGRVRVSCEGYSHPDDPYILKGSCGLEFTLEYSGKSYQQSSYHNQYQQQQYQSQRPRSQFNLQQGSGSGGTIFMALIVCALVYCMCCKNQSDPQPGFGGAGFGGGGGGGDGPGNRPDARPRPSNEDEPGATDEGKPSRSSQARSAPPPQQNNNNNSSSSSSSGGGSNLGGFWTGAGVGGLLGYLAGRNNNNNHGYQQPYAGYAGNRGWGGGFGGFGGGGGYGGGFTQPERRQQSSSSSAYASTVRR